MADVLAAVLNAVSAQQAIFASIMMLITTLLYLSARRFIRENRREKYSKVILSKTAGAREQATSIIVDVEARASKATGRDQTFALDFINWFAIRRDLLRAGLPPFPPIVYLGAAILSYVIAVIVIAAPIFQDHWVAVAIYPAIFHFLRSGLLATLIDGRRNAKLRQLVIFIESVQRAVAIGTAPDEAVAEAIKEAEAPLVGDLKAIGELLDLGYDFIDAINLAADRINLSEFDIFVGALTAQATTGGSVGDVLREVVDISRSRLDLKKKVATLTAEGRFNAMLLGSLPIGLVLYLRSAQPDYASVVWENSVGIAIYFATLGLAVFGAWLAMKIASVKV